jgi:hypothetical protein
VFHTELKRTAQLNPAKPLVIPPGADTLEVIGMPPGASRSDLEIGSLQARVAKYKRIVDELFPASGKSGASMVGFDGVWHVPVGPQRMFHSYR